MYVTILGRQPAFGVAELERLYGAPNIHWLSDEAALVNNDSFNFSILGGSQKAGKVVLESHGNWPTISKQIVKHYTELWSHADHKITLGISAYGFTVKPHDIQKTGLFIKNSLKKHSVSVRLVPNKENALNTATSHHNRLGLSENKVELLVIRAKNGKVIIAESVGAQNISALAARDQARPRTDAFVGMLPPKLARIMINLSDATDHTGVLWDPFCGTGTVLQEARLLRTPTVGSDLSDKMVEYTTANLAWLSEKFPWSAQYSSSIFQADAMTVKLTDEIKKQLQYVVCETYLGQPFSAPPSDKKLHEVRDNCNHIISEFLKNIHNQISNDTQLVLAIPAWRDKLGNFTHLPLVSDLKRLGYSRTNLNLVDNSELLYYRENQVVAREILLLTRLDA